MLELSEFDAIVHNLDTWLCEYKASLPNWQNRFRNATTEFLTFIYRPINDR